MNLLLGTSIISAFIAGMAALFAPCCITVLLPSYLASIFRERYKVFLMTFIFFLGILTVFLPFGLGMAWLGQAFSRYHAAIFTVGAAFLIALGAMLLTGTHVKMPFHVSPRLRGHSAPSVYILGIFSGIATTCCAPVLAGVLALSVLPGSVFWGGVYTLSYVLGMVAPLFVLALILDGAGFSAKLQEKLAAPVTYRLGAKRVSVSLMEALSGLMFVGMGALTIWFAATGRLVAHGGYQPYVDVFAAKATEAIAGTIGSIPGFAWIALFAAVVAGIVALATKQWKHRL